MGFNSAFKGLNYLLLGPFVPLCLPAIEAGPHEMKSSVIGCREAVVK